MSDTQKIWKSCLIDDAKIDFEGQRIQFHTVDRSLMRVVNKSAANGVRVAFNYPAHMCNMTIAFALEAFYEFMEELFSNKLDSEKTVLVISNKIEFRDVYEHLYLNGQRLSKLVAPLGRVKRNGEIKPIYDTLVGVGARHKEFIKDSKMLFSKSIHVLPADVHARNIGAVIVDVNERTNAEDIDSLLAWCDEQDIKSVIFIFTDPYSYVLHHLKQLGIPIWGWTPEMLESEFSQDIQDGDGIVPDEYMKNYFLKSAIFIGHNIKGIKKRFETIDDPILTDYFKKAREYFIDMFKTYHRTKDPLLKSIYETFAKTIGVLEKIIAPIDSVELIESSSFNQVHTLSSRIDKLRYLCDKLAEKSFAMAAFAQTAIQIIEDVFQRMQNRDHPKTNKVVKTIKDSLDGNKSALIITYRAWDSMAMYDYLEQEHKLSQDFLDSKNIYIRKFSDLNDIDFVVDTTYICGSMPFRPFNNRLVLRLNISQEIVFWLYPSELPILEKQIKIDHERLCEEFGLDERSSVMSRLLGVDRDAVSQQLKTKYVKGMSKDFDNQILELEKAEDPRLKKIFDEVADDLFQEGDGFEDDWDTDSDAGIDYKNGIDVEADSTVRCMKIRFTDNSVLFVTQGKRLPLFLEKSGDNKFEIRYSVPSKIKEKDIIIIVDNGAKNTVEQEILKVVHASPKLRRDVEYAGSWFALLKKESKRTNDEFNLICEKLHNAGVTVGKPAILGWLNGERIGPQDLQNIFRIGQAYKIQFIIDNYEKVAKSVRKIRSIHHRVLRRLSEIIIKKGIKAGIEDEDLIDEDMGLYIEDFSKAITMKKVKEITPDCEIPYNYLNKMLSAYLANDIENGTTK
ncbi:DrmE family protein [Nanoarchaeota archaeon]